MSCGSGIPRKKETTRTLASLGLHSWGNSDSESLELWGKNVSVVTLSSPAPASSGHSQALGPRGERPGNLRQAVWETELAETTRDLQGARAPTAPHRGGTAEGGAGPCSGAPWRRPGEPKPPVRSGAVLSHAELSEGRGLAGGVLTSAPGAVGSAAGTPQPGLGLPRARPRPRPRGAARWRAASARPSAPFPGCSLCLRPAAVSASPLAGGGPGSPHSFPVTRCLG